MTTKMIFTAGAALTLLLASAAPGRVTILHTNDSHTHIDDGAVPFSQIAAEVRRMRSAGENVILADAGDFVQGTAMGGYDGGKSVIELMNAAGYQVASPGNHEFDYGIKGFMENLGRAKFPLVSCNFVHRETKDAPGKLVLPRYVVVEAGGVKVAFVGVSTPTTLVSSKPSTFLDESGTYRAWDFLAGEDGSELYRAVQDSVNEAAKSADYVVVIGHLGVSPDSAPFRSIDVIAHTTNYVALIDGHSHSELTGRRVKNAAGKDVVLTQSGSYLGVLGSLTLAHGVCVQAGTVYPSAGKEPELVKMEDALAAAVERQLGVCVAKAPTTLCAYDPVSKHRISRSQGCAAGDFAADAAWWYANEVQGLACDFALMNGGNVRADIPRGDITYKVLRMVQPFGGDIGVVEASGQQVLDALEFGAMACGEGESGGFLHVAGLRYAIDKEIKPTMKMDASGTWVRGPFGGKYRVHDVKVLDRATGTWQALDLAKSYRVVGNAFTLVEGGDGFAMFKGSKVVNNAIAVDYLVLAEYAQNFVKDAKGTPTIASSASPLAKKVRGIRIDYENPAGAGRITFGRVAR